MTLVRYSATLLTAPPRHRIAQRALRQGMLTSFGRGKVQFAEYIEANVQLYGMRSNCTQALSPASVSSFVRTELARSLRSRVSTCTTPAAFDVWQVLMRKA